MQTPPPTPSNSGIVLDAISKRFGALTALDRVCVRLQRGEIHALLGENGAGKSTLMSVLFGTLEADEGHIIIDGQTVTPGWTTQKAIAAGIGMIHQHFSLVSEHSVLGNIVMPTLDWRELRIDWRVHRRRLDGIAQEFDLTVPVDAQVAHLSVGERQQVEILKMLYQGADVLILDEPTSVLTPQQTEALFNMLRQFKARGYAVVIITHKLEDAMQLSDRITVLRHGQRIATVPPAKVSVAQVAQMMVARQLEPQPGHALGHRVRQAQVALDAPVVLQAQNISVSAASAAHALAVQGVSLSVRTGEILGVAGVAGNGQSLLLESLLGLQPLIKGRILLNDVDVTGCDVAQRRAHGLSFVAEDRHAMSMVADMSVAANMLLHRMDQAPFSRHHVMVPHAIDACTRKIIREFDVRVPSPKTLMGSLSGGNQQKVVLSRELSANPCVLLVSEPSRGLDFAATAYVRERLLQGVRAGPGVLLVSSDLDELMSLAHRIVVMYQGRIIGELEADEYDIEKIGLMMAGVQTCEAAD